MFRSLAALFLCSASFAFAFPLHIGESWVWHVTSQGSESHLRTARILDSASVPEGRIWTVLAKDSPSVWQDTAKILEWPSGRQSWLRRSGYLGWELQPRDPADTAVVIIGSDTSSVWGEASSMDLATEVRRFTTQEDREGCLERIGLGTESNCDGYIPLRTLISVTPDHVQWTNRPGGITRISTPLPIHVWNQDIGMESALTWNSRSGSMDWRLIRHNGQTITPQPDRIKIPPVGTELTWVGEGQFEGSNAAGIFFRISRTTQHRVHWKILQSESDSDGWQRVSVAHTKFTCSNTSRCSDSLHLGSCTLVQVETSICDTLATNLALRFHPGTGRCFKTYPHLPDSPDRSESPNIPEFQDGWIVRWYDPPPTGQGIVSEKSWGFNNLYAAFLLNYESHDSSHVARKDWQVWNFFVESTLDANYGTDSSRTRTAYQLTEILPPGGEPPLAVRPKASGISNLMALARSFPNTPVRWSTASGRTGTLAASEIVQYPAALRGKTVFLQARLPDGRTWQGTHVVP